MDIFTSRGVFQKFFIILIFKTALLKTFLQVLLFNGNEGGTVCVHVCACTHAMSVQDSKYVYM